MKVPAHPFMWAMTACGPKPEDWIYLESLPRAFGPCPPSGYGLTMVLGGNGQRTAK